MEKKRRGRVVEKYSDRRKATLHIKYHIALRRFHCVSDVPPLPSELILIILFN